MVSCPFPGKPGRVGHQETATVPSVGGLWGKHANTTNQSTLKETRPPQAHTQQKTMDLLEAHAADGNRACAAPGVIPQSQVHTTAFQSAIALPNE